MDSLWPGRVRAAWPFAGGQLLCRLPAGRRCVIWHVCNCGDKGLRRFFVRLMRRARGRGGALRFQGPICVGDLWRIRLAGGITWGLRQVSRLLVGRFVVSASGFMELRRLFSTFSACLAIVFLGLLPSLRLPLCRVVWPWRSLRLWLTCVSA